MSSQLPHSGCGEPCRAMGVSVVSTERLGRRLAVGEDVVLARLDTLRGQETDDMVRLIRPLPHCLEHLFLNIDLFIASCGMVKGSDNVVDDLVYRHARVIPCEKDASMQQTEYVSKGFRV